MYSQSPIGKTVLDMLNNLEVDVEGMKRAENSLPPPDGKLELILKFMGWW